MTHKDLDGFVILVTGASTGFGRAIAVESAARGAEAVIINFSSNMTEAAETARMVEAEGAEPILIQGDVSKDEDCRRIAQTANQFGRIDALFNNAGTTIFADHADLNAVTGEDFLRIYATNVVGAYQMVRASKALLEAGPRPGAVISTASLAGIDGRGSSIPYAASKSALITMTKSLARSLAPKIRVNAICPGFIDTPWFGRSMTPDKVDRLRQAMVDANPLKVASTAEDLAGAAIFFASPSARHVTGEALIADAGYHLSGRSLAQR